MSLPAPSHPTLPCPHPNPLQNCRRNGDPFINYLSQPSHLSLICFCSITLPQNYRRNGDPFINYLSLNPVHDATGRLTHYVGVQVGDTSNTQHCSSRDP